METLGRIAIIALELAIMAAGAVLMTQTARRFLPAAGGRVRRLFPYILFAVTLVNRSWIGDENPMFLFPFFMAVFLLSFGGVWYARLVLGGIFFTLLEPLCMMVDSIERWEHLHGHGAWYEVYYFVSLLLKLAAWGLLWLLLRRFAPEGGVGRLSGRLWALLGGLCLGPLFSVLSFTIWRIPELGYDTYLAAINRIAYTMLPFTMLSALALLAAAIVLCRHEELEEAKRLSEVQAAYYESLRREQAGVRTLRHDMHNHVAAATALLNQGKAGEAAAYLASLSTSPALAGGVRICENDVANAVLASKAAAMEEQGLAADWEVSLPERLPIADTDLCALIGNALDNAVEAARQAQDKRVLLRMRADKSVLMLRTVNALAGPVQERGGLFKTTKADKQAHGFGLASMSDIARRYGGTMDTRAENGRFELVVAIPLRKGEAVLDAGGA